MKIVSWNVNGLRSLEKNDYWEEFLKGVKPDIFCLQETKASPEQVPEALLSPASFSSFFSSSQVKKGYSGVALYSKVEPWNVIYGMGIKEFDQEGRIIGAEYEDFWLLNAYFPNLVPDYSNQYGSKFYLPQYVNPKQSSQNPNQHLEPEQSKS